MSVMKNMGEMDSGYISDAISLIAPSHFLSFSIILR